MEGSRFDAAIYKSEPIFFKFSDGFWVILVMGFNVKGILVNSVTLFSEYMFFNNGFLTLTLFKRSYFILITV